MARFCSFRCGGRADILLLPKNQDEVSLAISECESAALPYYILGYGTNVLVRESGFRGAIICLRELRHIEVKGERIFAAAGDSLASLANQACELSLSGLEWAVGIPASVGGAVAMNAGAFGGEMSGVISNVTAIKKGKISKIAQKDCNFSYRFSAFKKGGDSVVLGAEIALCKGDKVAISALRSEYVSRRCATQPQGVLSAGSVFKRLKSISAGELIDKCGLKGFKMGGAMVSDKHANFIINYNNASPQDIENLIDFITLKVYETFGERLETEIEIISI